MGYTAARRSTIGNFNPEGEAGYTLLADWDFARAVVSAGRIVSIPTSGPGTQTLVVPSGSSGPLYEASAIEAGGKPAGNFEGDGTVDCRLYCSTLVTASTTRPFTIYIACQQRVVSSARFQHVWDGQYARCYSSTAAEALVIDSGGSTQLLSGVRMQRSTGAILVNVFNLAASAISDSSQTPDIIGPITTYQQISGFYLGGYHGGGAAYGFGGKMFRVLLFDGAHTPAQMVGPLSYLNRRYYVPIDLNAPGTIQRVKMNFTTNGGAIPTVTSGITNAITASGSMSVYFRLDPSADGGLPRTSEDYAATRNNAAGPTCGRGTGGGLELFDGVSHFASKLAAGWDATTPVEMFFRFDPARGPNAAIKNGATWRNLPFDETAMASLAGVVGDADLGGWRQLLVPIQGSIREFASFQDGAGPRGWAPDVYVPGILAFWGNSVTEMHYSGGWCGAAIGLMARVFPRPRQVGITGQTWDQMTAARAATIDPLYVATTGARRIVTVMEGINSMNPSAGNQSPAAAFASALACVADLRTRGWKIVMGKTHRTTAVSNANTDAYNALIDADANTHWDRTAQVPATITTRDGIHPDGAGAKLIAAAFAPELDALL